MNRRRGTLRGLHFQDAPHREDKLVRCTHGAVYDVIVDIRPDSPGFGRWYGIELTREDGKIVYAPRGTAHGYLTLTDDAEVTYQVSQAYAPSFDRGIRWDDPDLGIAWPFTPCVISKRDRELPSLSDLLARHAPAPSA